jgi:hypothetical protein
MLGPLNEQQMNLVFLNSEEDSDAGALRRNLRSTLTLAEPFSEGINAEWLGHAAHDSAPFQGDAKGRDASAQV